MDALKKIFKKKEEQVVVDPYYPYDVSSFKGICELVKDCAKSTFTGQPELGDKCVPSDKILFPGVVAIIGSFALISISLIIGKDKDPYLYNDWKKGELAS